MKDLQCFLSGKWVVGRIIIRHSRDLVDVGQKVKPEKIQIWQQYFIFGLTCKRIRIAGRTRYQIVIGKLLLSSVFFINSSSKRNSLEVRSVLVPKCIQGNMHSCEKTRSLRYTNILGLLGYQVCFEALNVTSQFFPLRQIRGDC